MRGADHPTDPMFGCLSPEAMVRHDRPLRVIRPLVNAALERLSPGFSRIDSAIGRPSIPPEQLLRAMLVGTVFSVRSARQLMEQLIYDMMFRRFVGPSMDAPVSDVTVFTRNRERLLSADSACAFLQAILADPQVRPLLPGERFPVDGTLIEVLASMKSVRPKDGSDEPPAAGRNGERDFHGEKRSNEAHASTTDPDARLSKKAKDHAARLRHVCHAVMESRSGLAVAANTTPATGTAEREAAEGELDSRPRATVGADKACDTIDFVAGMRRLGVPPRVTQNDKGRRSAIDGRTTRHAGYAVSQRVRKRIEEVFGGKKTVGGQRKTRDRGTARVGRMFTLSAAACTLVRMPKPLGSVP